MQLPKDTKTQLFNLRIALTYVCKTSIEVTSFKTKSEVKPLGRCRSEVFSELTENAFKGKI